MTLSQCGFIYKHVPKLQVPVQHNISRPPVAHKDTAGVIKYHFNMGYWASNTGNVMSCDHWKYTFLISCYGILPHHKAFEWHSQKWVHFIHAFQVVEELFDILLDCSLRFVINSAPFSVHTKWLLIIRVPLFNMF